MLKISSYGIEMCMEGGKVFSRMFGRYYAWRLLNFPKIQWHNVWIILSETWNLCQKPTTIINKWEKPHFPCSLRPWVSPCPLQVSREPTHLWSHSLLSGGSLPLPVTSLESSNRMGRMNWPLPPQAWMASPSWASRRLKLGKDMPWQDPPGPTPL